MKKVVLGSILALFLFGAALQTVRILHAAGDPRQLDYAEGIILWQASQVLDLQSAFHPLQNYPHVVFHYTPLYHLVVRAVDSVVHNPLISGRSVSAVAAFWLAGLFAWIVFRATRGYAPVGTRWFGAGLAGACTLLVPAMQWAPLARVDLLGLALEFTAIGILCLGKSRSRNYIAACTLLLLGLYTKQSLLAMPAAAILLTGLIRPARAVRMAGSLVVAGLTVLLILAKVTDGGVIRHWFLYNVNPFHLSTGLFAQLGASTNLTALIPLGLAALFLTLPSPDPAHHRDWRKSLSARLANSSLRRTGLGCGLVAIIGFVVSWGIGKEGANINYCLDWQLALCPLTGLFMVLFLRSWKRSDRAMAFLRPLVILLIGTTAAQLSVQAALDCNRAIGFSAAQRATIAAQHKEDENLTALIATFPGPVASENMLALLRAGKPVPFEPAIVVQTAGTGVFDESPLIARTERKFFDAFILTRDNYAMRFSPRMLAAIRANYKLYPFPGDTYLVYVRQ